MLVLASRFARIVVLCGGWDASSCPSRGEPLVCSVVASTVVAALRQHAGPSRAPMACSHMSAHLHHSPLLRKGLCVRACNPYPLAGVLPGGMLNAARWLGTYTSTRQLGSCVAVPCSWSGVGPVPGCLPAWLQSLWWLRRDTQVLCALHS